mmetsp:Transcript_21117/g.44122  ORF Transcript_21117/g.44122 Transcript_21117/m.44122 type:complete len:242 (-) Transcript_21117:1654-2379(-)
MFFVGVGASHNIAFLQYRRDNRPFAFICRCNCLNDGQTCFLHRTFKGSLDLVRRIQFATCIFCFNNHQDTGTPFLFRGFHFRIITLAMLFRRGIVHVIVNILEVSIRSDSWFVDRFYTVIVKISMNKINGVASQNHALGANKRNTIVVKLNRMLEDFAQAVKVHFILEEDSILLKQQGKCRHDIQTLCHSIRHDCFTQVNQYKIKRSKVFLGKHQQALCRVAKPPLNLIIVPMRLRTKVLE